MAIEFISDLDKQLKFVITFTFYSSNGMTPVRRKFRKFDILKSRQNRIYPNSLIKTRQAHRVWAGALGIWRFEIRVGAAYKSAGVITLM